MEETCKLFDEVLGPHKLKFKTVNKCAVVDKSCMPTKVYENNYCRQISQDAHVKQEHKPPKAQCSLNRVFQIFEKSDIECDSAIISSRQNRQVAEKMLGVPPWGGSCVLRHDVHIRLINTCPIDNFFISIW